MMMRFGGLLCNVVFLDELCLSLPTTADFTSERIGNNGPTLNDRDYLPWTRDGRLETIRQTMNLVTADTTHPSPLEFVSW